MTNPKSCCKILLQSFHHDCENKAVESPPLYFFYFYAKISCIFIQLVLYLYQHTTRLRRKIACRFLLHFDPKHCAGGDCVDVRLQAVGDMFLPLTYFYKINSQTKRSLQHLITAENSAKVRTKKEWLFEFKIFCRRIGQPNLKK